MADQADVERALVGVVAGALYPDGAEAASAVGADCRVYRGWPNAAALDADLAAGRVNVTVFPDGAEARDTTRWAEAPVVLAEGAVSLVANSAGNTAGFSGMAAAGQVAGVMADDVQVAYRVADGDTPDLVAAVLAARLRAAGLAVQVGGASVSVPGAARVVARVVADRVSVSEVRRQEQGFRVSLWCPSAASRDLVAGVVDAALAGAGFLALADGGGARLRYRASTVFDQSVNARLFRRDLLYTAEYATTARETLPSMLFGTSEIAANGGPVVATRLS
jgi:hypothetical protein